MQNTSNTHTLTSVQCIKLGIDGKKSIGAKEVGNDRRTGLEVETRQVREQDRIRDTRLKNEKSTYTCRTAVIRM